MGHRKKQIHTILNYRLNVNLSCPKVEQCLKNSIFCSNFIELENENYILLPDPIRQENKFCKKSKPKLDKQFKKEDYGYDLAQSDCWVMKWTNYLNSQAGTDKNNAYRQIDPEDFFRLVSVDLNVCKMPSPYISDTAICRLQAPFKILNFRMLLIMALGGATSP